MLRKTKIIRDYFLAKKAVIAVYLFGSEAREKARVQSDIDIAVLLKDDFDYLANFDFKLRLMSDIEDITDKRVDIVIINKADQILQHQIRKYGKIIFERNRKKRLDYEVKARKKYFDFLFRHRQYIKAMLEKL